MVLIVKPTKYSCKNIVDVVDEYNINCLSDTKSKT